MFLGLAKPNLGSNEAPEPSQIQLSHSQPIVLYSQSIVAQSQLLTHF